MTKRLDAITRKYEEESKEHVKTKSLHQELVKGYELKLENQQNEQTVAIKQLDDDISRLNDEKKELEDVKVAKIQECLDIQEQNSQQEQEIQKEQKIRSLQEKIERCNCRKYSSIKSNRRIGETN